MPEEFHLCEPKLTLRELRVETMVSQQLQNYVKMLLVLSLRTEIDKNVVYKNDHKLTKIRLADPMHQVHEYCRCVGQTKRHDPELKLTVSSPECSFRNVGLSHPQLMIARPKIDLRETSRTTQLIEQVIDARHRILVLHCNCVQPSVINTQSECAVLLLHEEDGCSPGRCAPLYVSQVLKLLQLLL